MSFYDDASLVFLPSGEAGKDGKAYSIKPTDGSGDFTFSRGANLSATRIDSNGLIEKGRENLLLQSNSFLTTWTTSNASVTGGQAGYDGSSDAWLLTSLTAADNYINQFVSSSGVQTYSVYAKAGTAAGIWIQLRTGNYPYLKVNLTNGTFIAKHSSVISYEIKDVGNGWYRVSFAANNSNIQARIKVCDASGSALVAGNIYIQDAQLEQGLVATEYIESGASSGKAGLLEDSPRFDYSGGASCPSLLLEPSRTNLVKHSEYIGSLYSEVGTSVTDNATQSPNGTNEAALIYEDLVNNSHWVQTDVTTSSSTTYTQSAFVKKKDSGIYASLRTNGVGANSYIIFDFDTATIVDEGSDIISSGVVDYSNGWYRIYMTYTKATISFIAGITNSTTNPIPSYLGTGKGYYLWGLQIEQGSYPTSYIPNHSGGSVTRAADINTLLNQSGVIGQTAGTILFDAYFDEEGKVNFSISDSSANNFISIETTSSNEVTAKVEQGGSTQATITTATSFFAEGDRLKCAIAYDDRDMAFYINGTQVNTAAPNLIPACDDIRFGNYDGSIKADQRVNRVVLFTTRISNGNLATLTS